MFYILYVPLVFLLVMWIKHLAKYYSMTDSDHFNRKKAKREKNLADRYAWLAAFLTAGIMLIGFIME